MSQTTFVTKALASNGASTGILTVDSNALFFPGCTVYLASTTQAIKTLKIRALIGSTQFSVYDVSKSSFFTNFDCSAYVTADSATVTQPQQENAGANDDGIESPLTTKGDLYGFSDAPDRIGVGTDGQVLTADASKPFGLAWEAAGGSGVTSFGAVGASPSANGATVSGAVATLQPADGSHPGLVSTTIQSFGGAKTFTGNVAVTGNMAVTGILSTGSGPTTLTNAAGLILSAALVNGTALAGLSGSNSGDVTLVTFGSTPAAEGASLSGQALTLQPADATHGGGVSTGAQTLAGVKTFSSAPVMSGASITAASIPNSALVNTDIANLSGINSGDVTLGAIGSSPDVNGARLSGQVLTLQPADATHGGVVTTGTQSFGGAKTFLSSVTVSGVLTTSTTTGIIAFSGGGQASATLLITDFNRVDTVGITLDSVKLPVGSLNRRILVLNNSDSALVALNVFPQSGGKIDALGTNAAYTLAGAASIPTMREFVCYDGTNWISR